MTMRAQIPWPGEWGAEGAPRLERALRRRIEGCDRRRADYSRRSGNEEDFRGWCRECDRGNTLRFALLRILTANSAS